MAQNLHDRSRINALRMKQRRGRVPQIVKPCDRHVCFAKYCENAELHFMDRPACRPY
jgi:hypothetical protein